MERHGRIGRFIDLSIQLLGKQHVGSVFFIGFDLFLFNAPVPQGYTFISRNKTTKNYCE